MKKKPQPLAVQFAAGTAALAAIGSGLLFEVDPVSCLVRGGAAYLIARVLASVWCALFAPETVEDKGGSTLNMDVPDQVDVPGEAAA